MRVPANVSLREWLLELFASKREYKFYKTDDWLDLREDVMNDHHWECERCEEHGCYSEAQTVHHEFEVRDYPELALTRWIDDPVTGEKREVLHPLCNQCHNEVHGRVMRNKPKPQLNQERFD